MQKRLAIKIPKESATDRAHAESAHVAYVHGMCGHKLDMRGWTQTKTSFTEAHHYVAPRCTIRDAHHKTAY